MEIGVEDVNRTALGEFIWFLVAGSLRVDFKGSYNVLAVANSCIESGGVGTLPEKTYNIYYFKVHPVIPKYTKKILGQLLKLLVILCDILQFL